MVMTSDETLIQIFAYWPMAHAKRVTRDNRKNPEYRVVAAIRKLRTDTNCPAGKSWPNRVKNEKHIGQFVSVHSFLIAATTRYSGFFLLYFVTRFACDIGLLFECRKTTKRLFYLTVVEEFVLQRTNVSLQV